MNPPSARTQCLLQLYCRGEEERPLHTHTNTSKRSDTHKEWIATHGERQGSVAECGNKCDEFPAGRCTLHLHPHTSPGAIAAAPLQHRSAALEQWPAEVVETHTHTHRQSRHERC